MPQSFHYDWDPAKAAANLAKHKVSFEDALALSKPDPYSPPREDRRVTIGESRRKGILLVVHTQVEMDEDVIYIRIISARKPTRHERRDYEQEN